MASSGEAGRTRTRPAQVCHGAPTSDSMSMPILPGGPSILPGGPSNLPGGPSTLGSPSTLPGGPSTLGSLSTLPGGPSTPLERGPQELTRAVRARWPITHSSMEASRLSGASGGETRTFIARFSPVLEGRERDLRSVPPCVPRATPLVGEPPPYLLSWLRSPEAEAEYAAFDWPLTSVDEVRRLLRCEHIVPAPQYRSGSVPLGLGTARAQYRLGSVPLGLLTTARAPQYRSGSSVPLGFLSTARAPQYRSGSSVPLGLLSTARA